MADAVNLLEQPTDDGEAIAGPDWGAPMGMRRQPPRKFAKIAARPGRVLALAVVSGIAFDLAVRQPHASVALSLWCIVSVVGVAVVATRRTAALVVLAAAAAFVPWFSLRQSPWLLIPDMVAFVALVGFAADISAGGPVRRSVSGLCRVAASAVEAAVETVRFLGRAGQSVVTARRPASGVPWRGIGRSVAIAAPVVFILFLLLVSGDALFAATFDSGSGLGLDHVALVLAGGWLLGVLATMATPPSRAAVVAERPRLRGLDAAVLLGGVAALFLVYAAVQLNGLLAGGKYVQEQTGLTYAQYARSGFFQLMAAATISFVVLCVVRCTVQRAVRGARLLRILVVAVVVLTQGLVIGSIVRIQLYSDVFGLTHLRLYTVVSAVWLGAVVLLAGVAALRRGSGEWMAVAASALAAVAVLAMNVVNPDLLVARENIGRVDVSTARFDSPYLATLSDDAVPWIIEHLDEVPEADRDALVEVLCAEDGDSGSVLSWNAAAAAADDARARLCG